MTRRLLGVVLCGGRSSRMGRDKSALPHPAGGTFLQHAIKRLVGLCEEVAISGDVESDEFTVIRDAVLHQGPVIGMVASLGYAAAQGFDACLFTPVDTPRLTIDDLKLLKASWQVSRKTILAISDQVEPLIGIYSVADINSMEQLAASEDRSLYRFIQSGRIPYEAVLIPQANCRNLNTPQDFEDHAK